LCVLAAFPSNEIMLHSKLRSVFWRKCKQAVDWGVIDQFWITYPFWLSSAKLMETLCPVGIRITTISWQAEDAKSSGPAISIANLGNFNSSIRGNISSRSWIYKMLITGFMFTQASDILDAEFSEG